jgi:hypothetical protein
VRKPHSGYGVDWDGPLPIGSLHDVQVSSADDERPVAMLYLPNPEMRSGWELYHVDRQKPRPQKRGMGFR